MKKSIKHGSPQPGPVRQFDVTVGAITAKEHVPDDETEDPALTDYLERAWADLMNPSCSPMPRCARCDGLRIRCDSIGRNSDVPSFFCHTCKCTFNRFSRTPFAGLQNRPKGAAMIPLLSRQMSVLQAGDRLGRTQKAILSWLLAFRSYLLELDPGGHWEARVRLGVRVAPHARCIRCGFEGGFQSGGFDPQGRRRVRCPACGRSRLLDVLQEEGQAHNAVIVRDSIDTAVRRRRKVFPKAVAPRVTRTATIDDAANDLAPRSRPNLRDILVQPRFRAPGPASRTEDTDLSAFLLPVVRLALSDDVLEIPQCPWCTSTQTEWHPAPCPNGLPGFRCRACHAYFTRVSNTPLASVLARSCTLRLVPMLGWRETAKAAAAELGVGNSVLSRSLLDWRRWLLLLDPHGQMEARVQLGLPVERTHSRCG